MIIVCIVIDAAEDSTRIHKDLDPLADLVGIVGQILFRQFRHKLDDEQTVGAFLEEDIRIAVSIVGVVFARWMTAAGEPAV